MATTTDSTPVMEAAVPGRHPWLGAWLALCFVTAVLAQAPAEDLTDDALPRAWRFQAEGSRIGFELAALGVFGIHGHFPRFEGEAVRDADSGLWHIETRIDATSLHVEPARYLGWARSPEFFDVERHPRVRFRSAPAPATLLREGGELQGHLLLRGIERPVRFQVAPARCVAQMHACTIVVSGAIDRRQFGMHSRRRTLSTRVDLNLELRAVPATR